MASRRPVSSGEVHGCTDPTLAALVESLSGIDPRAIGRILAREYPRTTALILSQLPAPAAAQILLNLPEDLRVEVMMRITRPEQVSEDTLAELARALSRELSGSEASGSSEELAGLPVAIQLLQSLDPAQEQRLLEAIAEHDRDVADRIREQMFDFDDVFVALDDGAIRLVLGQVENAALVLALRGATDLVQQRVLQNLPRPVSESLRDELERLGPVRLSDVEQAQSSIAHTARLLADRGEIHRSTRMRDDLV